MKTLIKASVLRTTHFMLGVLLIAQLSAQPAVSVGTHAICAETEALIPLRVQDFFDVLAFSFFMDYDSNMLRLEGIAAVHPLLEAGQLVTNSNSSNSLNISWFGNNSLWMTDDTLMLLRITALSDSGSLLFSNSCELALSDYSVVENVNYDHGYIYTIAALQPRPQLQEVEAGNTVQLLLTNDAALSYRWQQKSGDSWLDMQEGNGVHGVDGPMLVLSGLTYTGFDRAYRCVLYREGCSSTTLPALLRVNAVGLTEYDNAGVRLLLWPNPAANEINIRVQQTLQMTSLALYNSHGWLIWQQQLMADMESCQIQLSLHGLSNGIYVVKLLGGTHVLSEKILVKQ